MKFQWVCKECGEVQVGTSDFICSCGCSDGVKSIWIPSSASVVGKGFTRQADFEKLYNARHMANIKHKQEVFHVKPS